MTFEAFIANFPNAKPTSKGFIAKCPSHDDGTASLSIGRADDGGVLVKCFAGCAAQNVVAALGLTLKDLFVQEPAKAFTPPQRLPGSSEARPAEKPVIEKIYSYTDAIGREVYQAIRLKPKSFRQRHSVDGKWVWTMDGIERVLYCLPEVIKAETVWIVEGEKDADNLRTLGFTATCNVGGAGKWLDGYTESLAGKQVVICGDNDEPGKKHVELVFDSIAKKAKSVRIVKVPEPHKDVTDFLESLPVGEPARAVLERMVSESVPHVGGFRLPVYSMADLEPLYRTHAQQSQEFCLSFANWIPSFKRMRPMIRGELVLLVGDTGTGKTAFLQNIAANTHLKSLLFEMELPSELLFERFFSIRANLTGVDIETEYRNNGVFGEKRIMEQFPNLFICPESRLTLDALEAIITRSELKIGEKPSLVLIDYVQLIQAPGKRYERMSDVAEGLKVLAKTTRTIIVVASQVARKEDEEIGLHDAKDSGSLENSAQLVLGIWRDQEDATLLNVKVLKSTKGGGGLLVKCNFDGAKSIIRERSPISEDDMPQTRSPHNDE